MAGNKKFTRRLRDALAILAADPDLGFLDDEGGSLFTPIFASGSYTWAKVLDSDGLMLAPRIVKDGEGGKPAKPVELLLGVVVQSEEATSQTKPNPLGKAAIAQIPNGVWVNVKGEGRRRLDRVMTLFVVPKGAAPKKAKKFKVAKRNVENAAAFMPDAEPLVVPRGDSAKKLATKLKKAVRKFFKGPGRPRKS